MEKKTILYAGYGPLDGRYVGLHHLKEQYIFKYAHFHSHGRVLRNIKNNLLLLKHADHLFMEYLYESPLILISMLKLCGMFHQRIVVISHKSLTSPQNKFSRLIYKMVYSAIDTFLFFSPKNMNESSSSGMVNPQKLHIFEWGRELPYMDSHFTLSDKSFFISTGRENRDFKILIDAFSKTSASLEIYVNRQNYNTGNDYGYLKQSMGIYPNIKIVFVENTEHTYEKLCQRVAEARCVVIPLIREKVNYCLGLTSLVEAMSLSKPIISSPNPYSPIDIEKEKIGIYASTTEEWVTAINQCTEGCAFEMGLRARKLAEKTYNISSTVKLLNHIFSK